MAWDRRKILDKGVKPAAAVTVNCSTGKIRTKQSFKKECDINQIMKKYRNTGIITPDIINSRNAVFGDVSSTMDYQDSVNYLATADKAFDSLPAETRTRFQNNPAELLTFLHEEGNRDEAIELGIIPKPAEVAAAKAETPPEPTTTAPEPSKT